MKLLWWRKRPQGVSLVQQELDRLEFARTTQGGLKFDLVTVGRKDTRTVGSYIDSPQKGMGKVIHITEHRGGMGYRDLWVQWGRKT